MTRGVQTQLTEERLAELQQMCDAPSDAYGSGWWCAAANELLGAYAALADAYLAQQRVIEAARLASNAWDFLQGTTGRAAHLRIKHAHDDLRAALISVGGAE